MKSLFLIFIFFVGCKFTTSPYVANTPSIKLNQVSVESILKEEGNVGPSFKIALIADTHNYYSELHKLIKTINNNGPYAFVIVAGDVTNLGLLSEYDETRRYLNHLNFPFVVTVGNHDLLANGDKIYERMFGARNFSFDYNDVQFVFFNNNNWEAPGAVPDTDWVMSELTASSASRKVLVSHVPPNDRDRFTPEEISEWETLMGVFNISYYINGHNHVPTVFDFGGATQITVGAPSKKVYFELIVTPMGISHKKINF